MFMGWKTQHCQDVSLLKLFHVFSAVPIEVPAGFLVEINKLILKFL